MKNSKVLTAVLVIIMVLLAIDVVSRVLVHGPKVEADSKLEYKVVSKDDVTDEPVSDSAQYEEFLNEMANKGWIYDHYSGQTSDGSIVFRK